MSYKSQSVKCISLDLDGTLLNPNHSCYEISKENIRAIKEYCRKNNNKIIISTGKDRYKTISVFNNLCKLGFSSKEIPYLICLNGALILDTRKLEEPIFSDHFDQGICQKIFEYLRKNKMNYLIFTSNQEIIHSINLFPFLVYKFLFKERYTTRWLRSIAPLDNIQKIVLIFKSPFLKRKKKKLVKEFGETCYVSGGDNFYLEIVDKKVDKFFSLKYVAQRLGLNIEDFAAIGNDQNDVMSLENVGIGIGIDLRSKRKKIIYSRDKIWLEINNKDRKGVARAIYEMREKGLW